MSPLRQDLPAQNSPFIGREHDVAALGRLLDTARMITLTGAGGIGKTSLALQVAAHERGRFADGAIFVDLSQAVTGEHVLRSVARRLGVTEHWKLSLNQTVPPALRSLEALLVLDTCERVVAPLARLCRILLSVCPGLRLLATSREPLRIPGENIWRVPSLSLPTAEPPYCSLYDAWRSDTAMPRTAVCEAMRYEAVRLFVTRARQARPSFEVTPQSIAPIVRICQRLDGVPLAIELAAARVQVLSIEQLLERLDDRFTLLSSADQNLPERQRTMRAVVEWSHALLTDPEKALLRRLSLFANWSLDMAEDLFSADFADGDELLELHGSLLDKSLIVLEVEFEGIAYYRMLDTIRVYAAERLEADGETLTYGRRTLGYGVGWASAFAARMAEPIPWQARLRLLNQVESNRGNMDSFLNRADEYGQVADGLRICVELRLYWLRCGRYAEGAGFVRSLLASAPDDLPVGLRARALVLHGELVLGLEEPRAAREMVLEGLRLATDAGDASARAEALASAAVISLRLSQPRKGFEQAAEALEIAQRTGDRILELEVLRTLGALADAAEDHERAAQEFSAALRLSEEMGDVWSAARCRSGLGFLAIRRGDSEEARDCLSGALALFTKVHAHLDAARCLTGLGQLAAAHRDSDQAWEYLSEGVRQSVASGRRSAIASSLEDLARLAAAEKLTDRVVLLGAQSESLRQELGVPSRAGEMLRAYAQTRLGADASAAWQRARALSFEEVLAAALPAPADNSGSERSLTRREHQIAELAGAGLSNREIAEQLVISQATVARHIANIFAKLEISARGELAARLGPEKLVNSRPSDKTAERPANPK